MARTLAVLFLAASTAVATEKLPDDLAAHTDAVFADVAGPGSPGCAVGVMRHGELVHARGYGRANLDWDVPITPQTVFHISSVSKQFTAAVVLLLAADGKLSLDDEVRKWIPELPGWARGMTLDHLLHHTSGLRDQFDLFELAGFQEEDAVGEDAALAMVLRQKHLSFEPGAEFSYTDTGFFLLSHIVRRAGGKSLRELAQERIFGPLGMSSTHFREDHAEVIPRRAISYEPSSGGAFRIAADNADWVGDIGVHTTVEDLARWQRNFVEPRVGGPGFVAAMFTPGVLRSGTPLAYASGLMLEEHRGLRVIRHRGVSGGYRTGVLRIPEKRLDVIVLCNHAGVRPDLRATQVADLWLGEGSTPLAEAGEAVEAASPPETVEGRAGRYRHAASGDQRMILARRGKLYLAVGGSERALIPRGGDRYRVAGTGEWIFDVIFERDRFRWVPALGAPLVYERFEPTKPSPAELRALAGTYRSDELDSEWTVTFEDGALSRRVRSGPAKPLVPAVRDEFRSDRVTMRFRRDASRRVTGFVVQFGRIRDIAFVRIPPRR